MDLFVFNVILVIFFHGNKFALFFGFSLKCFKTCLSNFSLKKLIGASYIVLTSTV